MFFFLVEGGIWKWISTTSCIFASLFFVPFLVIRSVSATESSTVFSANVPFDCSIQNNNSGSVSMSSGDSDFGPSFLNLIATAQPLEVSGNGLSSVAIDYIQTSGREAENTRLIATVPINSGFDALYTYMQNGSSVLSSEGGVMEGGFPQLVSTPRPITLSFIADVANEPGQTYEFEVTLTCLQKSE